MKRNLKDTIIKNNLTKESSELYNFVIKNIEKSSLDVVKAEESLDLLDLYCAEEKDYPRYINFS